jgi:hypothetical protein
MNVDFVVSPIAGFSVSSMVKVCNFKGEFTDRDGDIFSEPQVAEMISPMNYFA